MSHGTVTVSALVHYLKGKIENDTILQGVIVEGELSNFSSYRSGHWYFSLKDDSAQIRCAMFSSYNRSCSFVPKDGDKVLVKGNVSVYEGRGELQMIVTAMKTNGIGELYLQFEKLKKKLEAEGLFDQSHKKKLPEYPFRIGLITGANTAARADVFNTLNRRWPIAEITEYPVLVQGDRSSEQIIQALRKADQADHDVILLVRGGGSIEDLWSFNNEQLARTIYAMQTPVVTGVGHEVDYTIVDFVSDYRAPTPTGAAEVCSPDIIKVKEYLDTYAYRLEQAANNIMKKKKREIEVIANNRIFKDPMQLYIQKQMKLDQYAISIENMYKKTLSDERTEIKEFSVRFLNLISNIISEESHKLDNINISMRNSVSMKVHNARKQFEQNVVLLDAYSPLKVLYRGYSIVSNKTAIINSVDMLSTDDMITIKFSDGEADAKILNIKK